MKKTIFRKKSLEQISSPEELNDYIHVTSPSVWLILAAVITLLIGMLMWSATASIDSFATGTAKVENGSMYIRFDNEQIANNVESGMPVIAGEYESRISGVGTDADGDRFALAPTDLADGLYPVKVRFRETQVLHLLFN